MHNIFIDLIKAIWPFLRESWFQGDSLSTWIRKHKVVVTWLVLVITLSISDLVLLREISTLKFHAQTNAYNLSRQENTLIKAQLIEEKNRVKQLADYQQQTQQMQSWLEHCQFTANYTTNTCPAPQIVVEYKTVPCRPQGCSKPKPPTKPKKPRQTPTPHNEEPPAEKPKETFRQKMKRVFGGKGSTS